MCGKISSVPVYPDNFILPNGRKALEKELETLSKRTKRAKEIKIILSEIPIVKTTEQNEIILPGNGFKLRFLDSSEGLFGVLDGTLNVKRHDLPHNTAIILASSDLGKTILGKKKGDTASIIEGKKERPFVVEEIKIPSKAKWLFRFDNLAISE